MEVEEARVLVPGHREGVHDLGRDERPGLRRRPGARRPRAGASSSPSKTKKRLRVLRMDVERRTVAPAGSRADLDDAELLDVGEERDAELPVARDALAFADLDHEPAA